MKLTVLRYFFRQFNWLIVIFTLLVFGGLIKLGLWQSERAIEKEQRLASITAYQSQPALSIFALKKIMTQLNDINDLPVKLNGNFDPKHVFLLDNQTNQGRLGYRVLQVFSFEGGNALVNLGWVQGSPNREVLPELAPLVGNHAIKGNVRLVDNTIVLTEQDYTHVTWPLRVQQVELAKFSQVIGQTLLPFVVYLDKTESIGYEKNWQPIVMPPEKHRAYAFQWFSLAIAWLVLMVYSSIYWARQDNNKKV